MYRQMELFDFIGKPLESGQKPPRTQFDQLFEKVRDPVCFCVNCLCEYCVNNVEQPPGRVKPGEMQEPCFNCDGCKRYSGDFWLRNQKKEECGNFVISDYGARRNRTRLKLIKAGGVYGNVP